MSAPITDAARQMAADLVNAEEALLGFHGGYAPNNFNSDDETTSGLARALARLCARFIAMQEDMAEIDRQLLKLRVRGGAWQEGKEVYAAAAIAAKHRADVDPLVVLADALKAANEAPGSLTYADWARNLPGELAKRGLELAKRK